MLLRLRSTRAFTLIELLVVILIVAILIAVALPSFLGQTQKAQDSAAQQRLATAIVDAKAIWTSGGQTNFPGWQANPTNATALVAQLNANEPSLSFVDGSNGNVLTNTGSNNPIEVWYPSASDGNEVAMCTASQDNYIFCFLADEQASLTANADASANQGSVSYATYSPEAGAQAEDVAGSAQASTFFVGTNTEPDARCVIGALTSGASVSGTCTSGNYKYDSTGWPSMTGSSIAPASSVSLPANTIPPAISGNPYVGAQLSASTGGWSPADVSYSYQWQVCSAAGGFDCTNVTGSAGTQPTYTVTPADENQYINVEVSATNSGGTSLQAVSSSNTPGPVIGPPAGGTVTVSGTDAAGQTLTATTSGWAFSPSSYDYTWQSCTSPAPSGCTTVSSGTSTTANFSYTAQTSDVGNYIVLSVQANNGAGNATASSTPTAQIIGRPVNTVAPSISGTAAVGDTLTANHGTWTYSPTSYTYQWWWCTTAAATSCSKITGATSSTYTLLSTDAGRYFVVAVAGANAAGTANDLWSSTPATGPIVNTPVNTVAPAITVVGGGAPTVGSTLSVSGTWTYSPTSYNYQWYYCPAANSTLSACTAISGATNATFSPGQNYTFAYIDATMSATNAEGTSTTSTAPVESNYVESSEMMAGNCLEYGGVNSNNVPFCDLTYGFGLFSPNGAYEAELTSNGVLEVVNTSNQSVFWASGTAVGTSPLARLQGDNNLIVSGASTYWATNTYVATAQCPNGWSDPNATCSANDYIALSNSGIITDYSSAGYDLWDS